MKEKKSFAYKLTLGWLYPELMSTYGDRGNIICLQKRCRWRGIDIQILELNLGFTTKQLDRCDLLFMGGAQDREQKIVAKDLAEKRDSLKKKIESGTPGLYICGAYQFLGRYYKEADGTVIPGLSILDIYTQNPGSHHKRLIGDIITQINPQIDEHHRFINKYLVGFENHGGRTYLGEQIIPFARVLKGYGNNGDDGTEGAVFANSFGTYMHGPILPKNPDFADYLISLALEKKYKKRDLPKLDAIIEENAREVIEKRLGLKV
jgi:CobQ-like glutamine amidotransferase family enzyme